MAKAAGDHPFEHLICLRSDVGHWGPTFVEHSAEPTVYASPMTSRLHGSRRVPSTHKEKETRCSRFR